MQQHLMAHMCPSRQSRDINPRGVPSERSDVVPDPLEAQPAVLEREVALDFRSGSSEETHDSDSVADQDTDLPVDLGHVLLLGVVRSAGGSWRRADGGGGCGGKDREKHVSEGRW